MDVSMLMARPIVPGQREPRTTWWQTDRDGDSPVLEHTILKSETRDSNGRLIVDDRPGSQAGTKSRFR